MLHDLGLAWGHPQDSTLRDQYVAEAFYRMYLTPQIHLTPDFQLIINPSLNPDEDVVAVFGLRLRVLF